MIAIRYMIDRSIGIQALSKTLTKKSNINLVEKYIFNMTNTNDEYLNLLYESLYLLKHKNQSKTENIKLLLTAIFDKQMVWNNQVYTEYREKIEEQDNFLIKPFEIEEGVLECKCGSKRTISFQRQTRSADEGSTTFAQCIKCGAKWRHNN